MAKKLSKEELREKWLKQATNSFAKLMERTEITCFDSNLFGSQAPNLICGLDVRLPEVAENELRRVRASRLKMLGYTWIPEEEYWRADSK